MFRLCCAIFFSLASSPSGSADVAACNDGCVAPNQETLLLQHQLSVAAEESHLTDASQSDLLSPGHSASCSSLANLGSFSTVKVSIGTPPEQLDLVADTGSNDIIVQSCECRESGNCPASFGKCYTGQSSEASADKSHEVVLSFGSGQIAALRGSDLVMVGQESVHAQGSLLLMVDQHLEIEGQFEGILGLGRPQNLQPRRLHSQHDQILSLGRPNQSQTRHQLEIPGFLDMAHVPRFSMCFNYGTDGVLGLNTPESERPMGSVGQLHWGLDFRGISVGDAAQPVKFCSKSSKKDNMQTACGLIPDSGTTLMMGPAEHIHLLFADLCQRWERCRDKYTQVAKQVSASGEEVDAIISDISLAGGEQGPVKPIPSGGVEDDFVDAIQELRAAVQRGNSEHLHRLRAQNSSVHNTLEKSYTFQLLLQNCATWMSKNTSLNQVLPSIFFHVAGSDGNTTDTLEMKPSSWILQMPRRVAHKQMMKIMGVSKEVVAVTSQKVCSAAFGPMEYPTELNGPVWIMGTPLFYEYPVHYDRSRNPPTVAFSREPCGSCEGSKIQSAAESLFQADGKPRQVTDLRMPQMDMTLPL